MRGPRDTTVLRLPALLLAASSAFACSGEGPAARPPKDEPLGPPHEIVEQTCESKPFSALYSIEPGLVCTLQPGSSNVRDCVSGVTCTDPDECQDHPFGRCVGDGNEHCDYGVVPLPCASDADCTALPSGHCLMPLNDDILCLPSGECGPEERLCHYPAQDEFCVGDFNCTDAPNGHCKREISFTWCNYEAQCAADADCGPGARCTCGHTALVCVDADCFDNADCGPDGQCLKDDPCGSGVGPFRCWTPADECKTNDDCLASGTGAICSHDPSQGGWVCSEEGCPSPP